MFAHSLAGLVKSEGPDYVVPVPPDFTACIKHLEASFASSAPSGSEPGPATLKGQCEQQYQTLETQALDPLIVDQWVIGGAAEEGVHVSGRELQQALKKVEAGQSQAQAAQELATSGRTLADFALETKVKLLAEGIRHMLTRKTEHVTQMQVVDYYNEHKSLFGVPKRRDLEIVRAGSDAEARKIKSELASGKTFASVVSKLPSTYQPIYSKNGVVLGYEPELYREPHLDHAIFDAKPNVLSGPVGISLGYYVFKVTRAYPPYQKSLVQSQAAIRQQLPDQIYKQALVAFIKAWRLRWRARTACEAGYVVAKCSQFKVPDKAQSEKEDPYTLN
jgi:PPIC-type PPIASE domain